MAEYGHAFALVVAALVLLSILSSVLSFRLGAPLLLVFLLVGLLAGEDGPGNIHFNDAPLAYAAGSLALAVILFDSGFATPLRVYRVAAAPAITLATLGVVVTAALAGWVAHAVLPLSWTESLLLGAAISSTDAAAVFFLLRTGGIRIRERVRSILEIESGTNDPVAVFLTLTLLELAMAPQAPDRIGPMVLLHLVQQFGLGAALGLSGGWAVVRVINVFDMDTALYPLVALSATLCVFAGADLLGGSGFLAVYLAGLVAGNRPLKAKYSLRRFQAAMTWLSQILMFLTLGLFATPSQFPAAIVPALLVAAVLTFIARPLATVACLAPFRVPPRETAFVAWVGLRGAVSILLAILPLMGPTEHARLIFNTAFLVVVFSLLIQGWTVRPVARRLGLIESDTSGLVDRIDVELPGRATHELVAYRLSEKSPVLMGVRIPRWARPSLVLRQGESMRPHQAGDLKPGDTVYLFCAERHIKLLDRIYAGSPAGDERLFLGDFSLPPEITVNSVAERYGLPVPPDLSNKTLRDAFAHRLRGRAELGDRIPLGSFELIVRDISAEGDILEVGLLLDNPDAARR
ncbi:MAG: potassium/proton antiporter [Gammaproteobacteria bacterium]|nr:potassium/proton antiporter [Gammaproteobacteria bacterium]